MENKIQSDVPKHIKELMQPTPSGIAKLLAAWSGLSSETQILILSKLDEMRAPAYLAEKVGVKALDSENNYVRYLAAREFNFNNDCSDEEEILKEKIENDPDPLVKYCLMETSSMIPGAKYKDGHIEELDDPILFFKLPHEARLAKVRHLEGNGEQIASLITHAVDHELKNSDVYELELFEILSDYVNGKKFWSYEEDNGIESLWNLIPKLPEVVSYPLIEHLPGWGVPEDVLKHLNNSQLNTLLSRPDIELTEFRKEIFFETCEKDNWVCLAAVSHNFDLTYEEFAEILSKPKKKRIKILEYLTLADDLELCLFDAIKDILRGSRTGCYDAQDARNSLERKFKTESLNDWQNSDEITNLKLYRLAAIFAPWRPREKQPIPDELMFLQEAVVKGDTWATFMAFSDSWSRGYLRNRNLDKHLPRIYEIDEDDWEQDEPNIDAEPAVDTEMINRIDEKLSEAVGLRAEIKALESALGRQRFLIYAVIGLVVWLLLVQH